MNPYALFENLNFFSYFQSTSNKMISIFSSLTVIIIFSATYIIFRQLSTQRLLKQKVSGKQSITIKDTEDSGIMKFWKRIIRKLGESTKPKDEKDLSHTRQSLSKAGYRSADASILYFGIKFFLAMFLPLGFTFIQLPYIKLLPTSQAMFLFVLFAVIGFYLPHLWIMYKTRQRQQELLSGFPDAMDLMVVCVESGLGLDAAINRTAQEIQLSHAILSEEFKLVESGLRAGQSRQDALRNLSLRTGLEDVNNLTSLLIQTDKFGTNIAQALRVHADSMRNKRRLRAEEAAAKVPVKLMFPLICFILPAMVIVVVGPGIIKIARNLFPAIGGG